MAARLTVVVSQTASRDPAATDLEETLVAELMMRAGLDATMVGPLEHIQPDDTDFLCISSFNYSFVVVSWLPSEAIEEQWERLGLSGSVQPIPLGGENGQSVGQSAVKDSEVTANSGKKIFHLQLTREAKLDAMINRLAELLDSRQVKTVGIDLAASGDIIRAQPVKVVRSPQSVDSKEQAETVPAAVEKPSVDVQASSKPVGQLEEDDEQWQHLDKLVDDLDELDL